MNGEEYDDSYFLHGKKSGKSLYENYRWMPELTIPMARTIKNHCGIISSDQILDFGCARGYLVKAFRHLGFDACGVDVSQWAIDNADEEVKGYVTRLEVSPTPLHMEFDWIIAKDVLEHCAYVDFVISNLMDHARQGVFVVVPLSLFARGSKYVIEEYEKDVTHIQRMNLPAWAELFMRPGWRVECAYRVPGVKCNYAKYERGNGFITARRIEE